MPAAVRKVHRRPDLAPVLAAGPAAAGWVPPWMAAESARPAVGGAFLPRAGPRGCSGPVAARGAISQMMN